MTYSDRFLEQKSGILDIYHPSFNLKHIKGIFQDDPQIVLSNMWSPISDLKNALTPLQDIQQVLGAENISSYISASGQAWKGTPPIEVNCSFYLVSFNKNSNIKGDISLLSKLCALDVTGGMSIKPHGGYKLNVYDNNNRLNDLTYSTLPSILGSDSVSGTVTLTFNSSMHTEIQGLLVKRISVQASTVSVKSGAPLYYYVNMSFVGYRPPIVRDIERMFVGD